MGWPPGCPRLPSPSNEEAPRIAFLKHLSLSHHRTLRIRSWAGPVPSFFRHPSSTDQSATEIPTIGKVALWGLYWASLTLPQHLIYHLHDLQLTMLRNISSAFRACRTEPWVSELMQRQQSSLRALPADVPSFQQFMQSRAAQGLESQSQPNGNARNVYIETYGCQMNSNDTGA